MKILQDIDSLNKWYRGVDTRTALSSRWRKKGNGRYGGHEGGKAPGYVEVAKWASPRSRKDERGVRENGAEGFGVKVRYGSLGDAARCPYPNRNVIGLCYFAE